MNLKLTPRQYEEVWALEVDTVSNDQERSSDEMELVRQLRRGRTISGRALNALATISQFNSVYDYDSKALHRNILKKLSEIGIYPA